MASFGICVYEITTECTWPLCTGKHLCQRGEMSKDFISVNKTCKPLGSGWPSMQSSRLTTQHHEKNVMSDAVIWQFCRTLIFKWVEITGSMCVRLYLFGVVNENQLGRGAIIAGVQIESELADCTTTSKNFI